ncbi:Uu.00g031350.m01.CDS01 [Anthostomella pinea]|uniref:Uu.00g031350.m01.CDS01 n=1 Tax=Anthostomella pinea TaxID=933095 RepID=A0AAI8YD28_9PEZI|nr:Uu.00g031350.m01.CDS01 [Anthostomella pinea]
MPLALWLADTNTAREWKSTVDEASSTALTSWKSSQLETWLTPDCRSRPSLVRGSGVFSTPVLLILRRPLQPAVTLLTTR